mmetsp:Transcript_10941/g.22609  ORF Transcript_10941/g.22609 Transcript_10941/m.22609 type:complete len:255 (+) Transcript_10941:398-1162(+)
MVPKHRCHRTRHDASEEQRTQASQPPAANCSVGRNAFLIVVHGRLLVTYGQEPSALLPSGLASQAAEVEAEGGGSQEEDASGDGECEGNCGDASGRPLTLAEELDRCIDALELLRRPRLPKQHLHWPVGLLRLVLSEVLDRRIRRHPCAPAERVYLCQLVQHGAVDVPPHPLVELVALVQVRDCLIDVLEGPPATISADFHLHRPEAVLGRVVPLKVRGDRLAPHSLPTQRIHLCGFVAEQAITRIAPHPAADV